MVALPFGAMQSYRVPPEFRSYEHVKEIEFIEIDPDRPYPRSVAYRAAEDGAQMLIRRAAPELDEIELCADEARALIEDVAAAGLFEWQRVYKPVQGTFVNASLEWRIEVSFDEPYAKRASSFKVEGEGTRPDTYDQVIDVLMRPREQG
jgi:hypothetical protein